MADQDVNFTELAGSLKLSVDKLEDAMRAFNDSLDDQMRLSGKAIENMVGDDRISMVRAKTRAWYSAFLEHRKLGDPGLSGATLDDLLKKAVRQSNARQGGGATLSKIDPDVLEVANFIQTYRDTNDFFMKYVGQMSGAFSIIRKTTKSKEQRGGQPEFFYEEPLVFAPGGEGARMITFDGSEMFGFAFGGAGIVTIQLFSPHSVRGIATRTIMLYPDDRTHKDYIPGIMLRYSDDTIRPVASNIVARFLGEYPDFDTLWDARPGEVPRKIKERDPEYVAYEAFGIDHHVKAQHRIEFRAIVDGLSSDGAGPETQED